MLENLLQHKSVMLIVSTKTCPACNILRTSLPDFAEKYRGKVNVFVADVYKFPNIGIKFARPCTNCLAV